MFVIHVVCIALAGVQGLYRYCLSGFFPPQDTLIRQDVDEYCTIDRDRNKINLQLYKRHSVVRNRLTYQVRRENKALTLHLDRYVINLTLMLDIPCSKSRARAVTSAKDFLWPNRQCRGKCADFVGLGWSAWQGCRLSCVLWTTLFCLSGPIHPLLQAIMSKSDFSQSLLASSGKPQTAVDKIPIIARGAVSDRAKETLNLVLFFPILCVIISFTDCHIAGRKVRGGRMRPSRRSLPCTARGRREEMEHIPTYN